MWPSTHTRARHLATNRGRRRHNAAPCKTGSPAGSLTQAPPTTTTTKVLTPYSQPDSLPRNRSEDALRPRVGQPLLGFMTRTREGRIEG